MAVKDVVKLALMRPDGTIVDAPQAQLEKMMAQQEAAKAAAKNSTNTNGTISSNTTVTTLYASKPTSNTTAASSLYAAKPTNSSAPPSSNSTNSSTSSNSSASLNTTKWKTVFEEKTTAQLLFDFSLRTLSKYWINAYVRWPKSKSFHREAHRNEEDFRGILEELNEIVYFAND